MALTKLGGVGYLLSAATAVILSLVSSPPFLAPLLFVPLLIHPASIVLRFLGWRRIGGLIERRYVRILPLPLLAIGLAYFAILASGAIGATVLIPHYGAASIWAAYSLLEGGGYLSLARSGVRPLYVATLNIPGVTLILTALLYIDPAFTPGGNVEMGLFSLNLLRAGLAYLAASALAVSYTLLRREAMLGLREPRPTYAELEAIVPTRASPQRAPAEVTAAPPRRARQPSPQRGVGVPAGGRIVVHVISRGEAMSCRRCGSFSPLGSSRCTVCGALFYQEKPGLKCPVCGAPLSLATKLSPTHRVCGICFSDLGLSAG